MPCLPPPEGHLLPPAGTPAAGAPAPYSHLPPRPCTLLPNHLVWPGSKRPILLFPLSQGKLSPRGLMMCLTSHREAVNKPLFPASEGRFPSFSEWTRTLKRQAPPGGSDSAGRETQERLTAAASPRPTPGKGCVTRSSPQGTSFLACPRSLSGWPAGIAPSAHSYSALWLSPFS